MPGFLFSFLRNDDAQPSHRRGNQLITNDIEHITPTS
ncbi:hypothetical protein W822_05360 [Advenella kashmirensis W13003]|uniref:Uncharacterized protein n=1 Tax=Advenella kashmirensis W13003 TaxID=1424334 RepID=V8QYM6_9BURK|nr:hypothetical protein W822_05360 [Advenella kashmirensis W13003]